MKPSKRKVGYLFIVISILLIAIGGYSINERDSSKQLIVNYFPLDGGKCSYYTPYPNKKMCVSSDDVEQIKQLHPEWLDKNLGSDPVLYIEADIKTTTKDVRATYPNAPFEKTKFYTFTNVHSVEIEVSD